MSKTRSDVIAEGQRKGIVAGAATVGAVAASVLIGPVVGVVGAVPALYFGYKWWQHRAENGIKF